MPPGAGDEITNCSSSSGSSSKKIMVAEEMFVNCYNFNPKSVEHASNYIKMMVLRSKKVIYKEGILFAAPWSRKKYFTLLFKSSLQI